MLASTKAALSFALPLGLPPAPGFRRPRRGGSAASPRASLRDDNKGDAPRPRGLGARTVAQQRKRKDANEVSEPSLHARQLLAATPPTSSSRATCSPPATPRDPVHELISQARDSEGRIVVPADLRKWLRALEQAVPVLEAALERTRPGAVDAPATPAECQALDLLHIVHELDRQRPSGIPPQLLARWSRERDDGARRLGTAAVLPSGPLAKVPALQAAARACGDAKTAQVQAEVLALRFGGPGGRPERRRLLLREWMTLDAQQPTTAYRLIRPLAAFMRTSAYLASGEAAEQFLAHSLQDCMREVLKLLSPEGPQLTRAESTRLNLLLQGVGQAFSALPGLSMRSAALAFAPCVRRALENPPPWLTEQSVALALCVLGVCQGLGAHGDCAESAALAESLLALCTEHWLSQDTIALDDADHLGQACSVLLKGTAEQITQKKARLLSSLAAARNTGGQAVDSRLKASWLFGMCCDPARGQPDPSALLPGLACLPLAEAADLLGAIERNWNQAEFVSSLRHALASGDAGLDRAGSARVAFAWAVANGGSDNPRVMAQLTPSVHERFAAMCREAWLASQRPARLLSLEGIPESARRQLVHDAYQHLGPSGLLIPAKELSYILGVLTSGPSPAWRVERVHAIADLFVATARQFELADFATAHMTVQRDLKVLMSRPDLRQHGVTAMQAAGRFFKAIPDWVNGRLEQVPLPGTQVERATAIRLALGELLDELRCRPRSLLSLAGPVLENELERLQAMVEPPPLPGERAWASSQ